MAYEAPKVIDHGLITDHTYTRSQDWWCWWKQDEEPFSGGSVTQV